MRFFIAYCVSLLLCTPVWAANHVNILVYHHVSESTPASTSVSPDVFRSHMQLLQDNGFTVVDMTTAIAGISGTADLPEKAVAITFDDGYRSIYDNAWPILKAFNYPFTLFVATDAIDEQYGNMLDWDQLREMKAGGVDIANHSSDHGYLVRHRKRDATWLAETQQNIEHAQARLIEELGSDIPNWFAYPYGEYNRSLADRLSEMGYVGFAQHSGGAWTGTNQQAIPRFAAAGIYANPKSLLTKLKSQPMPVDESLLPDMLTESVRPRLQATLIDTQDVSKVLNCFIDGSLTQAEWETDNQFSLVSENPLSEGRHRYNCTARSKTHNFYYWFSKPWLVFPDTQK